MRNPWVFATCLLALMAAGAEGAQDRPLGEFKGARPTEYPGWFKESFLEFKDDVAEAADAGRRVMLLFHQDGCPYCNALVEGNLSQRDIERQVREQFDVVALNMWGDQEVVAVGGTRYTEKTFAEALRVQFTPTLIFFDESGRQVLRLNGYLPPERFKLALDFVGGRRESEMTYRDYVARNAPAPASGPLNGESFFMAPPYDLRARAPDRPVAVFFEQKQCPDCDTLHERVLSDPETRALIGEFTNIQLDMWSDTPVITPEGEQTSARAWARALDVKYAPTIVLMNPGGEEVIRSEAFFKTFHTQSLFDYVLTAAYREQSNFQRYLSTRSEHIREQGRDVNIWR